MSSQTQLLLPSVAAPQSVWYKSSGLLIDIISLPSPCPNAPIPTTNIGCVVIAQIPSQAAKLILSGGHQDVHFCAPFFLHEIYIPCHVPFAVACGDNRTLGLQQFWDGVFPFVNAGRVAEARMKKHKAIEVRVIGVEVLGFMEGVEVFDVSIDFEFIEQLEDGAEGVGGGAFRHGHFAVAVHHGLWANEDDVKDDLWKEPNHLLPDIAGER